MEIVCLDLEGVLSPEIWIGLAERTGVEALRQTTRDNPDYDALMRHRMRLLDAHGIRLPELRAVVETMAPLAGARDFLDRLRARFQVVILSDTYYEIAMPIMAKLGYPTLLCHRLEVDGDGRVTGYRLRQPEPKRASVRALQKLNFRIIAAGDSHNDIAMLHQADAGILFRPPAAMAGEHPDFPVVRDHRALHAEIEAAVARLNGAAVPAPRN